MADEPRPEPQETDAPQMPEANKLLPQGGLTNRHKRWIFFAAMGIILLVVLANVVATNPRASGPAIPRQQNSALHQNPTPAQIRDMENTLAQQETALLDDAKRKQQQLEQTRAAAQASIPVGSGMSADDLQRAAALQDAAQARAQYEQMYGTGGQPGMQRSQLQAAKEQEAYKSLFADNLVRQDAPPTPPQQSSTTQAAAPVNTGDKAANTPNGEAQLKPAAVEKQKSRQPLDFDPAARQNYWLPEGTVMEAVLTNRLDGDAAGPVNCMITTDVYLPGTRLVLIPQGARVLGEASKVSSIGEQRLAVAFHRILVPGLKEYSIPLDKEPPALAQAGELGCMTRSTITIFRSLARALPLAPSAASLKSETVIRVSVMTLPSSFAMAFP